MKRTALHLVGNLAPILSGLLTAPLTARSLGVEARGELALILLVSTAITVIGNFGLSWLARADVARDPALAAPWNRLGLRTAFALLPLAILTAVVVSFALSLKGPGLAATVALFALSSMSASRGVTANILIALGRHGSYGRANLAMTVGVVAVIVGAFFLGRLDLAVAVSATTAGLCIQMYFLGRSLRQSLISISAGSRNGTSVRLKFLQVLPRAIRSWLAQLADTLANRADVVLVSSQAMSYQLGLYSVVALIPQLSVQVYSTLIQQSYSRNRTLLLTTRTTMLCIVSLLCGVLISAVSVPAAYWLIPIVFGDDFIGARAFILPAAAISVGLATLAPISNDVALRKRTAPYFGGAVAFTLILALVVAGLAGVQFGLYGLAIGFVVLSFGYVLVSNKGDLRWIRMGSLRTLFGMR